MPPALTFSPLHPGRSCFALRSCVTAGQRRRAYATLHQSSSGPVSIRSILIANRGEIALRVSRTATRHGIRTTTLYTDPDRLSQHAHCSPWSFNLGEVSSYLDQDKILSVAEKQGCDAIHPGYGFLSENADFAKKCAQQGIIFIGPPASAIQAMGDKARSKEIMNRAGVPCVPGYHGSDQTPKTLAKEADKIGYPVLIKAVRGGGGKGMRIATSASEFIEMLNSAKSEARNSFGNDEVLVEKYITTPRHVEVQVFADKHQNCLALGERDCSIQRRHQKILEESPAPNLPPNTRKDLWNKARAAALAVNYEGAGTVEFIFDNDTGEFFFMEMNTRLQVEHPVTEMITGLDLVYWQIMVAEGKPLPVTQEEVEEQISQRGHAIEARIYAENPAKGFIPDSGKLLHVRLPEVTADVRIDSGFVEGDVVSNHYDPMISKLIVRGDTREEAVLGLATALGKYEVAGPVTNIEFLRRICKSSDFMAGAVETGYIDKHHEELFQTETVENEVLAQAAIAMLLQAPNPALSAESLPPAAPAPTWLRISSDFHTRTFQFTCPDEEMVPGKASAPYKVTLTQNSADTFTVSIPESTIVFTEVPVQAQYDSASKLLTTYFPQARRTAHVIPPVGSPVSSPMHLFSLGSHTRLVPVAPSWLAPALGTREQAHSLLSPMPCKILRVDIQVGDVVKKDQSLLVIESMKMETVIRSPGAGLVVKRVVHGVGDVVGAQVELVEFEDDQVP